MRISVTILWFMLSVMFFSMALFEYHSSAHTSIMQIAEGETLCKEVISTGSYCTASTCPSITITFPGLELTGYLGSNYNNMKQRINGSEISQKSPCIFFNVSDWQYIGNPCVELWKGVFCNLTSRIIHISLPELALTGYLDSQLTEFHNTHILRHGVSECVFLCMSCFIAGFLARSLCTNHAGVAVQVADVNVDGGGDDGGGGGVAGGGGDNDGGGVADDDAAAAAADDVAAADDDGADDDSDDSMIDEIRRELTAKWEADLQAGR